MDKLEEFFCSVVGSDVDVKDCDARRTQAVKIKDAGKEHYSLFKCFDCSLYKEKKQASINRPEETGEVYRAKEDKKELLCAHCKRPPDAIKSKWNKTRGMHISCYQQTTRVGKADDSLGLCVYCGKPPEALKSVWIKKRNAHHTCYKNNERSKGEKMSKEAGQDDPICVYCNKPKSTQTLWSKKRGMHQNCWIKKKKKMDKKGESEDCCVECGYTGIHKEGCSYGPVSIEKRAFDRDWCVECESSMRAHKEWCSGAVTEGLSEEEKEEAVEEKVPAEAEEETVTIVVDFSGKQKLHEKLLELAKDELRTPEMQLLYLIRSEVRRKSQ